MKDEWEEVDELEYVWCWNEFQKGDVWNDANKNASHGE